MPPTQGVLFEGPPASESIGAVDFWAERNALAPVIGIDEAGRGPLAGPVVAAAVVLPPALARTPALARLDDSKRLSASARDHLFEVILALRPIFGIGRASPAEIDALNILEATRAAMRRALAQCVRRLGQPAGTVLVDGNLPIPGLGCAQYALVGGDGRAWCIAAASVLAKVVRDRAMVAADFRHPGYGFARHKGYGTAAHCRALENLGPSPIHRHSFRVKTRPAGVEGPPP